MCDKDYITVEFDGEQFYTLTYHPKKKPWVAEHFNRGQAVRAMRDAGYADIQIAAAMSNARQLAELRIRTELTVLYHAGCKDPHFKWAELRACSGEWIHDGDPRLVKIKYVRDKSAEVIG